MPAAPPLTTDLATGVPFEKGLRTRVLATAFSAGLGLAEADRAAVFHVALLRSIGCTAHALPGGGRFTDEEIHLWTFDDDGAVTCFRHYCDTAKHIAATRGRTPRRGRPRDRDSGQDRFGRRAADTSGVTPRSPTAGSIRVCLSPAPGSAVGRRLRKVPPRS